MWQCYNGFMIYTDQARVEAYLQRELTDYEGAIIDDVIEYISDYISAYCNRSWFSIRNEDDEGSDTNEDFAEEASDRYFDGNGQKTIYVDEFTGLTGVAILDADDNEFASYVPADLQLFPQNETVKDSIRLRQSKFPDRVGCVKVTAKWGSGQAPKSVIMIATILVGKFLKKTEINKSTFKSESIEGYSYSLQTAAEHDKEIQSALATLDMNKRIVL